MSPDVPPLEQPDTDGDPGRGDELATLGLPFWVVGVGTTGWLVARNFRDDLEPLSPEVSVLAWSVGATASFGGAGALDYGTMRAARERGVPPGLAPVGLGLLAVGTGLLAVDGGVWLVFPDSRGGGGTAETLAVGGLALGALAGLPGLWDWVGDRVHLRRRSRPEPLSEPSAGTPSGSG